MIRRPRHRLKRLAVFAALLVVCTLDLPGGSVAPEAQVATLEKPNVLVIITDDQRNHGTMAMLPRTRRIFGRGGTRFTNAFATTPLCCPSRASLFTGKYAHNHRVFRNHESDTLDQTSTIQRYLAEAGYRNAIFGKYLYGFGPTQDPPHFDNWATTRALAYTGGKWNVQGEVRRISRYSTDYIAAKSAAFIQSTEVDDARPWFLIAATQAPHAPAPHPDRHDDVHIPQWKTNPAMLERDRSDKPRYVRQREVTLRSQREFRKKQLRALPAVDELTDSIFDTLADLGERGRTLAFFVSDNGMLWGEHRLASKRHAYTQSVSIPLFARWPGEVDAHRTDDRLAGMLDIPVTIMDAIDTSPDNPMDGRSFLADSSRKRILLEFWNELGVPTWASIRARGYQYVEYYRRDGTTSFREYYDLGKDPWQLVNLLHDGDPSNNPDTTRRHALLRDARRCEGTACP